MSEQAKLSARYRRFADEEAAGRSPLYEQLARGIADDDETLGFLLSLPAGKQQPNLLLAALRHVCGTPPSWAAARHALITHRAAIRDTMLTHATQTNEPGRCAVLLPILATLPQPLALIEVGASAGLCLLPDFYHYDYGRCRIGGSSLDHPVLSCAANTATPLPSVLPEIVWRAGLDLNPLDPADPDHAAWLQTLVWPEQTQRLGTLRAALKIAAAVRPRVVKGSLLDDDFERLAAEAPSGATLVIFHTAVLAYVADRADRDAFARRARLLSPCWIANEAPQVFGHPPGPPGRFVLSVNGVATAWTDPHGAAIDWIS